MLKIFMDSKFEPRLDDTVPDVFVVPLFIRSVLKFCRYAVGDVTSTLGVSGPADSKNEGLLCSLFHTSSGSAVDYFVGLILTAECHGFCASGTDERVTYSFDSS